MKILMLTTKMDIGGAETHIAELCRGLKTAGHEPEVASAGGAYADELAAEGIVQHIMPLDSKSPANVRRCLSELRRLITDGDYDVVHAHARIPAFLCGVLRRKIFFRYTSTAHLDFAVNALWRRITDWGEATIAVSDDLKEYLIREYGVPAEQISVTVNGIDMKRFAPSESLDSEVRSEFGIDASAQLIVYISRLDEDRSAPAKMLCRVMPQIRERFPDARLIIVGGGNDFENVKAEAERAGDSVILTGPRYDIHRFAAAADVFCAVSRSALEAMAAECPVVLSGNQGHMGVFTEDKLDSAVLTNFCCRGCELPSEELLLQDVLSLLESSPEERAAMGRYNRSVVAERYSLEKMCGDYIRVYETLPPPTEFRESDAVISGYFGYGNSGDDTALDCLVAAIREEKPGARISVLCRDPDRFGREHGVRGVNRESFFATRNALKKTRLLISGGGSLLQNSTSDRSLHYYAGIIRYAKRLGARVFVCANGVGPITGKRAERLAAKAVNAADRISVRDESSRELLRSIGVDGAKISVTADPAFRLALTELPDVRDMCRSFGMRDGERYFAVSLRDAAAASADDICRALREIYLTLGLTPVFVSMQESEDKALCERIAAETCGEAICVPTLPPREMCAVLSKTELVLSMRLHLMIYAAVAGVPAVGISVDPKLDAASGILGEGQCIPFDGLSTDAIVRGAEHALGLDRAALKQTAAEQASRAKADALAAVALMEK